MSQLFNLNVKDFIKGLILSVLTAIVTIIYSSLQSGSLEVNWKLVATTAITSALSYLVKNLLTNSSDQFMKIDQ
ncbi:hypothetical protein UFOVP217_35 [uncultured Caudovirales phage]|jgi:hypothetical protein|uniref:Holin n=1 Tax=uncultured Caudovirales phage TaxID=2100421 RepID=A0A6J7WNX7_9CAUD|nr:hypothetical protein UFOVP217_35 [uncultured Caudovirales phage]